MSIWGWILFIVLSLAGLAILLLALFHVRYRAAWRGAWDGLDSRQEGSVRIEWGFPGFMRSLEWPGRSESRESGVGSREQASHPASNSEATPRETQRPSPLSETLQTDRTAPDTRLPTPDQHQVRPEGVLHVPPAAPGSRLPTPDTQREARREKRKARDPHRWRRALFRLATDAAAWGLLARHGARTLRRAFRLLGPHLEVTAGHPDPALLGRAAGWWHAAAPLLPRDRAIIGFRFQDRSPTLALRLEGGFSALALLRFGAGTLWDFPWAGLARRAWGGWRGHALQGWRARAYRKLQEQ